MDFKLFSLSQNLRQLSAPIIHNHLSDYHPLYQQYSPDAVVQFSSGLADHQIQRLQLAVGISPYKSENPAKNVSSCMMLKSKEIQPVFTKNRT